MTIAKIGSLWQLVTNWWSALTLAGIGAFVTWFWNLRKANQEVQKLKAENAALKRKGELRDALATLRSRAAILLLQSNLPSLSRAEWASFLSNPLLIDEALVAVKAEREPGKDDRWIIR